MSSLQMSEEPNIKNEASKPEGDKKELNAKTQFKKIKDKLPKGSGNFNFYWIYIVILIGIALMWFPNFTDNTQKIEWPDFVENVLKPGDVRKIVIVNEQTAEIYIKTDHLKEPKYEKVRERPLTKEINPGPHFVMKIEKESFTRQLDEVQKVLDPKDRVLPSSENRTAMSDYMGYILPIVLMVGLWFFLMRRM